LHYVIIGNGGAGTSALQTIRELDKSCDITIISREQYPTYSPCSLPNLLAEEIDKTTIFRFDKHFYKNYNAKFLKNSEAIQVLPKIKKIKLVNGKTIEFDKLLIATGSKPIIPNDIKGLDLDGVAVIVGGGFIGIETATMLKKRGINVMIIEMLPNILSRMLDPDISEKVLEILKQHGIKLLLDETLKSINGDKKIKSVSLKTKTINCDMVVIAIGVTPNISILKETDIIVNRGIIVDSTMQTNIKNIYAAGDVTEVKEQIEGKQGSYAIWPNAIEQGRIAGLNIVGKTTKYDGAEVINVLDVFDIPIVAIGSTSAEIGKCKVIKRFTPSSHKKLLLKNNRIVGLQFVGSIRNVGVFYSLMKNASDISQIKERLLDENFVIAPKTT
jgi:NAD(P)H-nitrite reductase large subunit